MVSFRFIQLQDVSRQGHTLDSQVIPVESRLLYSCWLGSSEHQLVDQQLVVDPDPPPGFGGRGHAERPSPGGETQAGTGQRDADLDAIGPHDFPENLLGGDVTVISWWLAARGYGWWLAGCCLAIRCPSSATLRSWYGDVGMSGLGNWVQGHLRLPKESIPKRSPG